MNDIVEMIANYGFPMALASYLLVRMDKRLASLDDGIRALTAVIELNHK